MHILREFKPFANFSNTFNFKTFFFSRKQQEIKPIFGFIIGKEDKGIRGKDWGVGVTGGKGKKA